MLCFAPVPCAERVAARLTGKQGGAVAINEDAWENRARYVPSTRTQRAALPLYYEAGRTNRHDRKEALYALPPDNNFSAASRT